MDRIKTTDLSVSFVSLDRKSQMSENVGRTFLGLTGVVWCIIAGLGYGTQNVFAKLGYEQGLAVPTFILIRHMVLFIGSYTFGKLRGINFDVRAYPRDAMSLVFQRCIIGSVSKSMQYGAISLIPLTLSSCISFTTGPMFSALVAFLLIGEKLSRAEVVALALGIIGTAMLTMPQWFSFLDLDNEAVNQRLEQD